MQHSKKGNEGTQTNANNLENSALDIGEALEMQTKTLNDSALATLTVKFATCILPPICNGSCEESIQQKQTFAGCRILENHFMRCLLCQRPLVFLQHFLKFILLKNLIASVGRATEKSVVNLRGSALKPFENTRMSFWGLAEISRAVIRDEISLTNAD